MKLVLDTNVLLVSISSRSKYHWLFQKLLSGSFVLCLSNEIVTEYEEIISHHMGKVASDSLLGLLDNLNNVEYVKTYFNFKLIPNDPDDDKFVDCAIASSANYLVTHDNHFNVLKSVEFPRVVIIDINSLMNLI